MQWSKPPPIVWSSIEEKTMNAVIFETVVTEEHELHCTLPASLPTGCRLRVVIEPIPEQSPAQGESVRALTGDDLVDHYQPKTELGQIIIEARRAYIESGGKPMSWDEINAEVRERRGGLADD
jgi:hypothetical protein